MRNLVIDEILRLMQLELTVYNLKPWDQWSNKDLLEFYSKILIDVETEEF